MFFIPLNHLNNNIFNASKQTLYLFFIFKQFTNINTINIIKKKTKGWEGFILPLLTLLYSLQ
jgi:hypothetical protein